MSFTLRAAGILCALACLAGTVVAGTAGGSAQVSTSLAVDDCLEMDEGGTAVVPIRIDSVDRLLAWEIYFAYDRNLVEVVDREVRLFLAAGPNSNVFNLSDPVPNSTGIYRLAAADVSLDGTAESGSGLLATVTVRALQEGVSPAAIFRDTSVGLGPRLSTVGGQPIGDTNGDDIFDGTIESGQIAIGRECDPVAPTASPELPDVTIAPSHSVTVTSVPGGPDPTETPDDPTPTPTPTPTPDENGNDATPFIVTPEPSPGSTDTDDDNQDPTDDPTDRVVSRDGGGGGDGLTSTSNDTFWAIVLIGGGVGLGLLITLALARMTRRTA